MFLAKVMTVPERSLGLVLAALLDFSRWRMVRARFLSSSLNLQKALHTHTYIQDLYPKGMTALFLDNMQERGN